MRNRDSWNLCATEIWNSFRYVYGTESLEIHTLFMRNRDSWNLFATWIWNSLRYVHGTEILEIYALFMRNRDFWNLCATGTFELIEIYIRNRDSWTQGVFAREKLPRPAQCHFPGCWTPVWKGSRGMQSLVSFVGVCRVLFMSLSGLLGLRLKGSWDMRL